MQPDLLCQGANPYPAWTHWQNWDPACENRCLIKRQQAGQRPHVLQLMKRSKFSLTSAFSCPVRSLSSSRRLASPARSSPRLVSCREHKPGARDAQPCWNAAHSRQLTEQPGLPEETRALPRALTQPSCRLADPACSCPELLPTAGSKASNPMSQVVPQETSALPRALDQLRLQIGQPGTQLPRAGTMQDAKASGPHVAQRADAHVM